MTKNPRFTISTHFRLLTAWYCEPCLLTEAWAWPARLLATSDPLDGEAVSDDLPSVRQEPACLSTKQAHQHRCKGGNRDSRHQPASPCHTVYLRDTIQPMIPPTMTPSVNVAAIVSTG